MKRNIIIIIDSIVFAIAAIIAGSMLAGLLTDILQLPPFAEEACANIILDITIIISQVIVLIVNYKKEWIGHLGLNGKISDIKHLALFIGAGMLVFISFLILNTYGIISYNGNGFLILGNSVMIGYLIIMFIRMLIVGISEELLFRVILGDHVKAVW